MRNETLVRGTRNPTTLSKWRNNTGERGPAMCVHGGTSDPVSRCIIRSKCTGNDTSLTSSHWIRDETKGPTKKGIGTLIKRKDIEPA